MMHLTPSFFMLGALLVAWWWEWIGTVAFTLCGAFFIVIGRGPWVKATFAAPCFATAWLFLLNWRQKRAHPKPVT
jgi:hypothetical protein